MLSRKNRFKKTDFLISASLNEQIFLQSIYNDDVKWAEVFEELITLDSVLVKEQYYPIVVHLRWVKLNKKLACFWRPTSTVVHHGIITEWLKNEFTHLLLSTEKWGYFSPMNFESCVIENC